MKFKVGDMVELPYIASTFMNSCWKQDNGVWSEMPSIEGSFVISEIRKPNGHVDYDNPEGYYILLGCDGVHGIHVHIMDRYAKVVS